MAVMNPCCCKLQLGATIVAIVNMVFAFIELIWYAFFVIFGVTATAIVASRDEDYSKIPFVDFTDGSDRDRPDKGSVLAVLGVFLVIISILVVISFVISFILAIFLFIGARSRNYFKCRLWFAVTLFFLGLFILSKLLNIGTIFAVAGGMGHSGSVILGAVLKELGGLILTVAIEGYQLWVVYAFMDELLRERNNPYMAGNGAVHYIPKAGDNPPPYGQGSYVPYVVGATAQAYPQKPTYPVLPPDEKV